MRRVANWTYGSVAMATTPRKQSSHGSKRPARRERAIYRATLEELAEADYGALSVESVAARARVNKTTLYRRWPTKAALVHAALESIVDAFELEASTGSLRGDLLTLARRMLKITRSVEAQSLLRVRLLDEPEPELARIAAKLQARRQAQLTRLLEAASARGEVRRGTDLGLVLDLLGGMIHVRTTIKKMRVDDALLQRAVDILVSGISLHPTRAR
ncbi:MAG TPA: TetR/AcrR family transcriptional regulator C-terminal ligand-binding domain-containing protein [Polyangiaceae bacterium]|jgi:AcrR family transcriptional regulator|nr:TetR/AcrR family transcriptional regulator C-terminal ligand-binding domain-containing protein [Polyangiaceae bacterium]